MHPKILAHLKSLATGDRYSQVMVSKQDLKQLVDLYLTADTDVKTLLNHINVQDNVETLRSTIEDIKTKYL